MAEERERTIEEKYEVAKKVLMLVERAALAHMIGLLPPDKLNSSAVMIANMCHVANHMNGEVTFDCGPKRVEHHAQAMVDYDRMYETMLKDIAEGNDVCDAVVKGIHPKLIKTPGDGKELEIDDEDLAKPITFH